MCFKQAETLRPMTRKNLISLARNQNPKRQLGEKSEDYPMQHVRRTI